MSRVIYRIENLETMNGMWYNNAGVFSPILYKIAPKAKAIELPMPFDMAHKADDKNWYSAGGSIDEMNYWFSREDALNLVNNGFKLYHIEVDDWVKREHEVLFTRESVLVQKEIPIDVVW